MRAGLFRLETRSVSRYLKRMGYARPVRIFLVRFTMPIKFRCLYCDQLLGIARRKSGSVVNCPKCGRAVTVPIEGSLSAQTADKPRSILERHDFDRLLVAPKREKLRSAERPSNGEAKVATSRPETAAKVEPIPQQRPLEDEEIIQTDELLEESDSPSALQEEKEDEFTVPVSTAPLPSPRMAEPEHSMLGTLIAIGTILLVFGLGFLTGRYAFPVQPAESKVNTTRPAQASIALASEVNQPPTAEQQTEKPVETPEPAPAIPRPRPTLTGRIFYSLNGQPQPDYGATVIAIPSSQSPDRKIASLGLRPLDQNLQDKPGVNQLQQYGGALAIVDDLGEFRLQVQQTGLHYVLVLSSRAGRRATDTLYRDDLAILQRFFEDGEQLLGDNAFLLVTRDLKLDSNEPIRFTF